MLVRRAVVSDRVLRGNLAGLRGITARVATVLFWLLVAASILLALRLLGIDEMSRLLDPVLKLLPQVLAGFAILAFGHLLAGALRDFIRRRASGGRQLFAGPGTTYWTVMGLAVIAGIQQIGIQIDFIAQVALIAIAVGLASLGLAFALGARQHVANLIARSELDAYQPGDRVRVDGIEGTVAEVRRTAIVVASDEGLATIPAARFAQTHAVRLDKVA